HQSPPTLKGLRQNHMHLFSILLCHVSTVVPSDLQPGPQPYILHLPWFLPVMSHVSKFYLANPIYTLPCPMQFSLSLSICSPSDQSSNLTLLVVYKLL